MANEQNQKEDESKAKPPDDLRIKEKDDSVYVTEELSRMQPLIHRSLVCWFIIVGVASIWFAYKYWPEDITTKAIINQVIIKDTTAQIGEIDSLAKNNLTEKILQNDSPQKPCPTNEKKLVLISILFGILGGTTHGFASLMNFRGQRRLFRSWSLWYFGRPILGGMMAVIFYISIRAGLFTGNSTSDNLNIYGIAAFSAIVGLFTDQATEKLRDVFKTLFAPKDGEREGKLKSNESANSQVIQ